MAVNELYVPTRLQANGVIAAFAATFEILAASHLVVQILLRADDSVVSTATEGVDYTVSINQSTNKPTVTFIAGHIPTALQDVFLTRVVPLTQVSDIPSNNLFQESAVETMVDKVTMIAQQNAEAIDRAVLLPATWTGGQISIPTPESGKYLVGNSTNDGYENADLPDPSILVKAETADAEAGTDDAKYMTAAKVKAEVQKAGAVTVPLANIPTVTGAKGGTGADLSAAAKGAVPFFNAAGVMAALAAGDAGKVLLAAGANAAPVWGARLDFKIGTFQRDVSADDGAVAYTGVGFTPKFIIFFASISSTPAVSIGFSDGTLNYNLFNYHNTTANAWARGITTIYMVTGNGVIEEGVISALGADGFTVTWTKQGSPTGTADIYYLAVG